VFKIILEVPIPLFGPLFADTGLVRIEPWLLSTKAGFKLAAVRLVAGFLGVR
jgi:hypothetical protein